MDHKVGIWLALVNSLGFPKWLYSCSLPGGVYESSSSSTSFPTVWISIFLIRGSLVVSISPLHYFVFHWRLLMNTCSHANCHLYIFFSKMSLQVCCHVFIVFFLLLICRVLKNTYLIWIIFQTYALQISFAIL